MRVRRLSALFWLACAAACVVVVHLVYSLGYSLPSVRPAQDPDDSKWASVDSKIRRLEAQLGKHREVVGDVRAAMLRLAQRAPDGRPAEDDQRLNIPPPNESFKEDEDPPMESEPKVVVKKTEIAFDESACAANRHDGRPADIQMLDMYAEMSFEDTDGGAWKQGWPVEYREAQWSARRKLRVFVVPHSHNDPGWLKTFENYYKTQTKAIFDNMVEKLPLDPARRFIWAEVSFLAMWWEQDASEDAKNKFLELLHDNQIEIVTGGWVMNDEANSHWIAVAQQLTKGHQWLLEHLNYHPRNAWAIDPFGHSSTQPYLLRQAGLHNSVIQRVHYRVKKELAMHKQLEFRWRQLWDGTGETEMFTHMMPFYSYDIPHSCGPDPKVCCQFDFRRLPGNGITCPWGVPPKKIIKQNVAKQASLILDQWRKKSQLYRSDVVLVPLGDDFRYDRSVEWDDQFTNYEKIFDYINNNEALNAEIQFGTLQDYFTALHREVGAAQLPALSGDFFTYADRGHHYWSGYYTSRPFYKGMDRVLLAYLRAAEMATAQAMLAQLLPPPALDAAARVLPAARAALALFQHHDGVTGTARDEVRRDYAVKMHKAIQQCQHLLQASAYYLLGQPPLRDARTDDVFLDVDDVWRAPDQIPSRITITLDEVVPTRRVALYNALGFARHEIVHVFVNTPHVEVLDPSGAVVPAQVSPVPTGLAGGVAIARQRYQLSWLARTPPLGLAAYTVRLRDRAAVNKHTSYAKVRVYNAEYVPVELPPMFVVEQSSARRDEPVSLRPGNGTRFLADKNGLLMAAVEPDGAATPLHMDFVSYESQSGPDNNSGAYLFLPRGAGTAWTPEPYPETVAVEGPLAAALYVALRRARQADVVLVISSHNNPSLPQTQLDVGCTVLLRPEAGDLELALRLATPVRNDGVFYTDLNGYQMIKRRHFDKLPLQANFYPLGSGAYLEDGALRVTLLASTPLGVASTQPGQIEVMQDRRLSNDDNRGLNQGVLDNVLTRHVFRVLVERPRDCGANWYPNADNSGALTLGAHVAAQTLLQPLHALHYTPAGAGAGAGAGAVGAGGEVGAGADVVVAVFSPGVAAQFSDGRRKTGHGVTLHRARLTRCYGRAEDVERWYPPGDGKISIPALTGARADAVHASTLTFARATGRAPHGELALCPHDVRSVFIDQYY